MRLLRPDRKRAPNATSSQWISEEELLFLKVKGEELLQESEQQKKLSILYQKIQEAESEDYELTNYSKYVLIHNIN